MRKRHGPHPFGRGPGPGRGRFSRLHHEGEDFPERGFGRLLGHGDLRYVILHLLEEKPRHGYEIIKALEELSSGVYSPSPGAIYPTLAFLEDSGWATVSTAENKKLYSITKEGKHWLEENRESLDLLLQRFSRVGEKMSRLKHWMGRADAEEVAGNERSPIRKAMHGLKAELFSFLESNKDIKQQVASIIERATEEIRKIAKK